MSKDEEFCLVIILANKIKNQPINKRTEMAESFKRVAVL